MNNENMMNLFNNEPKNNFDFSKNWDDEFINVDDDDIIIGAPKKETESDFVFDNLTPFLANVFYSNNKEAYNYLVKSKQDFYTPKELIEYLSSQNFSLSHKYSFLLSSVSSQIFIEN